jgi:hypothetical protein
MLDPGFLILDSSNQEQAYNLFWFRDVRVSTASVYYSIFETNIHVEALQQAITKELPGRYTLLYFF